MTTPAGWYPDVNAPGTERYWDGAQWTAQARPMASQPFPPPVPAQSMPGQASHNKSWFLRHKILSAIGVFVVLAIIGSAMGSGSTTDNTKDASDDTPIATQTQSPAAQQPAATKPPVTQPVATKPAAPKETAGQRNAKRAAENYLEFTAFSRKGLIEQLSSSAGDGYSVADATYAVDALHINFNEQAYKAAKNYLSFSAFSRKGLIEQLESAAGDQYTHSQAVYGADKALAEQ
jgi:hypothetical protein